MRSMKIILLSALVLFPLYRFYADGETRPAKENEKKMHATVVGTFKEVIPDEGPKGWTAVYKTEFNALQRVAVGCEVQPLVFEFAIEWEDAKRKNEVMEKRTELYGELYQKGENSLDQSVMDKYEKLAIELGDAAEKGDMEKLTRLSAEMEKLAAIINSEGDALHEQEKNMKMETTAKDLDLKIVLRCNAVGAGLGENFYEEEKIKSCKYVFRSDGYFDTEAEWREGVTVALLGNPWTIIDEGDYKYISADISENAKYDQVYTISVEIVGDRDRANSIMKKIDWNKLASLVN